jgi:S1-C subfamily serine protease
VTSPEQVDATPMLDASVSIRTVSHVRIDSLGDSVWEASVGSGFLVNADTCEIWTNHHVVEGAAIVEVFPRGQTTGSGVPARVVNSTPRGDLAILHMDRCDGIQVAKLGDSAAVRPGEDTFAVGNPLGSNPDSISRGIISHTERYVEENTIAYLQTDASINQGNSGGALFNRDGEVVGINTAIASRGAGGNIGIGYALPVNIARQIAAELRTGPPRWGDAGLDGLISPLLPEEAVIFGVPEGRGAIIVTDDPLEGPVAGLLQHHDVIHRIGGVDVAAVEDALRIVSERRPGDAVDMELMRGGLPVTIQVTLADGWVAADEPKPDSYQGYLGMTLEMWDDRDGEEGLFTTPVITHVQSLGPAHRALIASSQRAYAARGPYVTEYRLDVKTVTGVVLDGEYHDVKTPDALNRFAEAAFRDGKSLLLEIQHWARENPVNPATGLAHAATAFFKVNPQPAPDEPAMVMAELDG